MANPAVVGYKAFDLYGATTDPGGNITKAKQELAACGQPNGFTTGITYRSDRPKEVAAAQALQASLAQAGIKTTLHGFPTATYDGDFAGVPKYEAQHGLGISFYGWAARLAGRLRASSSTSRTAPRSARRATPTWPSSTTRW